MEETSNVYVITIKIYSSLIQVHKHYPGKADRNKTSMNVWKNLLVHSKSSKISLVRSLLVEVLHDKLHLFRLRNWNIPKEVSKFHDLLRTLGTIRIPTRQGALAGI